MDYSVTALLASVRRRAMLPSASAAGTADADLLQLANEELQGYIVPLIMELFEEYFLFDKDYTLTVGRASYRIPPRAMGAKLREVVIISNSVVRNLVRMQQDELEGVPATNGPSSAFYVKGNHVVLVPPPSAADTLRMTYYQRPNELVAATADWDPITAINTSTNTITTNNTHGYTTSSVLDLYSGTSGFENLAIDQTPTVVPSTTELTFSSLPTSLAIGDYVGTQQKAYIPQIPADLHPLLVQRVVCKVLEMRGDFEGLARAESQVDRMRSAALSVLVPRVDGEPKIIGPGTDGLLGSGGGWPDFWSF